MDCRRHDTCAGSDDVRADHLGCVGIAGGRVNAHTLALAVCVCCAVAAGCPRSVPPQVVEEDARMAVKVKGKLKRLALVKAWRLYD